VYGGSSSGFGVYGTTSGNNWAIYGVATSGDGVYGQGGASGGYGVVGNATNGGDGVYGECSGTGCVAVYAHGNLAYTGMLQNLSDERLKRDIAPLTGSLDQLLRLRGVSFYWKEPGNHGNASGLQRGFIAQEYETVFPEWVTTGKDGFKMIQTAGLDSLEVESIRELKAQNDDMRAKLEASQARMTKLEERLDTLSNGRDPITGGAGFGKGMLGLLGVGFAGAFGLSRWKRLEPKA
jgi:hypothetical protein